MNAKTDFKVPYIPNHALNGKDLEVVFFVGEEGINKYGFRTLEGILLTKELADHFQNEDGSDKIPSHLKRQRDLEKSRSKPLKDYFRTRKNTVLPGLSICLSHLKDEEEIIVGNRKMIKAVIPADCDRHIADGQNRTELFQSLLTEMPELATQTLSVKFLVSDTDTLEPVTEQIKQLFSDFHHQRKPTTSQNLYFDSSKPYSRLLRRFLDLKVNESTLWDLISVSGKLADNNLFILKQLQDFLNIASASTAVKTNALLTQTPEMADQLFNMLKPALTGVLNTMPIGETDAKNDPMYSKAIYFYGCAWVCRSIIEEGMSNGTAPDWTALERLKALPLLNMTESWWTQASVVQKIQLDNGKAPKYIMQKGSEKLMGRRLCKVCGIYPCDEI
ncbi:DGQHR domain-containing protein [Vibrio crassostreae]|mgnify:CR=1 FL=1|uniref:DNA sulfur modification protein DndB n=1 Tax=Vibrio crassostreae TaxID=246167 RepID=UPI0010DA7C37|nr:DNA sulfur modification protein DndB [Vibrio crassostreae]TCU01341.1 DGQHR domain-containing protein [Vibrio crassostreae]CAK2343900.1 DGQHR domain-containing protein [Vibrio crassostreae]CAK2816748.1 DGQHR domain-containing protein [Vibrio crassostreae]CAK2901074.1 DGQHR domain-containing protein [Vibrio crassostreae]CAK3572213.1 DGQHR domain-containing protein [Vibrio crassostreae]